MLQKSRYFLNSQYLFAPQGVHDVIDRNDPSAAEKLIRRIKLKINSVINCRFLKFEKVNFFQS
jgi:hypothetical protein